MSPKRAKTSHKLDNGATSKALSSRSTLKGKQKAPSFDFFQDIPLDIMSELLSYLDPLDILHLARTTKNLRRFFMSKASIAFWEQALARTTLPPCPDDLSAPGYVNFMLSEHCLSCLRVNCKILSFPEARTQLCERCTLREFKRWEGMPEGVSSDIIEFVPSTSERLTAKEKNSYASSGPQDDRFHVATAVRLSQEFKTLRNQKRRAWLDHQRVTWGRVEKHADACAQYLLQQVLQAKTHELDVEKQNKQFIRQKLLDLGFEEWEIRRNVDIDGVEFLTETKWETIKDEVVATINKWKRETERCRLRARFQERISLQISPAYSVFISDLSQAIVPTLAEVLVMMTDDDHSLFGDLTSNQPPPEGAFDAANAKIPEFTASWRSSQDEALLDVIRHSTPYRGQDVSKEVLFHASTIFLCRSCNDPLTYPTVLIHHCFLRELPPQRGSKHLSNSESFIHDIFQKTRTWQPNRQQLQFSDAGYYHTVAVLGSLGKALTTPSETMVSLNPYVECLCKCYHPSPSRKARNRKAMRWLRSLYDCRTHDSGNYEDSFCTVNDADIMGLQGYLNQALATSHEACRACREIPRPNIFHLCNSRTAGNKVHDNYIEKVYRGDTVVTIP